MNISKQTIDLLKADGYSFDFYDNFDNIVNSDVACELSIGFKAIDGGSDYEYIGKRIKATKKETTYIKIMDTINSDSIYKSFASEFNKLLPVEYRNSINIYATTYGIGVFCLFGLDKGIIDDILNKYGIDYTNEYSDANLVYRYKISKSKENINKIKAIK